MSDGGTVREVRMVLDKVSFDNNVLQQAKESNKETIYTISENRTGFFRLEVNNRAIIVAKQAKCKSNSRDFDARNSGDLYLFLKIINPEDGTDSIMRIRLQ